MQNGVIMVSHFEQLRARGIALRDAESSRARQRLRPVLMTALLASIGLVPAALSTGIGSDLQKPLATAIIGGMVLDVVAGTLFPPAPLYSLFARRVSETETEVAQFDAEAEAAQV